MPNNPQTTPLPEGCPTCGALPCDQINKPKTTLSDDEKLARGAALRQAQTTKSRLILCAVFFACACAIYFTGRHFGFEQGRETFINASGVKPGLYRIEALPTCGGKPCERMPDDTSAIEKAAAHAK